MARNRLTRWFKSLDAFGHPINLHFDNKGTTHKTCVGSVVTIVFGIMSLIIIYQCTGHGIEQLVNYYEEQNGKGGSERRLLSHVLDEDVAEDLEMEELKEDSDELQLHAQRLLSAIQVESHYAQVPYDVRAEGKVGLPEDNMVFVYLLDGEKQTSIDEKFAFYMDLMMTKVNPVNGKLLKTDLETCQGKISQEFTELGALKGLDLSKVYCLPKNFASEVQDRDVAIVIDKCNYTDRN